MKLNWTLSGAAVMLTFATCMVAGCESCAPGATCKKTVASKPAVNTVPKTDKVISMESILREMTDRERLSYFPKPTYKCKQASSYDRKSKVPNPKDGEYYPNKGKPLGRDRDGGKGWFANADGYSRIGIHRNQGRREDVIMRHNGPGALVRIWNALSSLNCLSNTIVRIYLDNNKTPAIEMELTDMVGGKGLVKSPYSYFVSKEARTIQWKGRNIYFPIPYQKSCLVTLDFKKRKKGTPGAGVYYQINYREYPKGTKVKTFSMDQFKSAQKLIESQRKLLTEKPTFPNAEVVKSAPITIAPDKSVELKLSGAQAIKNLAISLKAKNQRQALRSTVIEMFCDGERTLWCPVGGFFGVGYSTNPVETFFYKLDRKGNFNSYWVMPFKANARVILHNYGKEPITVSKFSAAVEPYTWSKGRSMYFRGIWHELRKWDTRIKIDAPFAFVDGKGVWVGDALTVFNTYPDWWGEGDEKIYVDGEKFPSHFGTGTEDYYGYSWCRPYPFSFPFHAQADGSGNKAQGMSVNARVRTMDAIPFTKQIRFTMEVFHPFRAPVNWAPTALFYAEPGAKCNFKPDIKAVKHKVALEASDIIDRNNVRYRSLLRIKKRKNSKRK